MYRAIAILANPHKVCKSSDLMIIVVIPILMTEHQARMCPANLTLISRCIHSVLPDHLPEFVAAKSVEDTSVSKRPGY